MVMCGVTVKIAEAY